MQRLHRDERLVHRRHDDPEVDHDGESTPAWPGKRTLTEALPPRTFTAPAGRLDRQASTDAPVDLQPALLAAALAGAGQPLPEPLRHALERALAADLSSVRIRTDAAAAHAAATLAAHAFAIGHDIVFAAGRYRPDDDDGLRLLAHEVAHTVQQAGAAPRPHGPLEVSRPGDAGEVEADRFAAAFLEVRRGGAPGAPATLVARAPAPGATLQGEWQRGQQLPRQAPLGDEERQRGPRVEELGRSAGDRPIQVYRFPGREPGQRILLIGGMHGNERAGLQIVDTILDHLRGGTVSPRYELYVVPVLHPDNAASRSRVTRTREGAVDPNRDFPAEGTSLAGHEAAVAGTAATPQPRPMLPETAMLLRLIERITPTRIVQVHGTIHPARAGFSRDAPHAAGAPADPATARAGTPQDDPDGALCQQMAAGMRDRRQADQVEGNRDGRVEWAGGADGGTSLGEWGSAPVRDGRTTGQRDAMSIITVEPSRNHTSFDPGGGPARAAEVLAFAQVIEQFIIDPQDPGPAGPDAPAGERASPAR